MASADFKSDRRAVDRFPGGSIPSLSRQILLKIPSLNFIFHAFNHVLHEFISNFGSIASFGHKKEGGSSKLAIELNFIVNEGKSVSLSDKFKLITNGKEDPVNKMKSKDIIAGFYERQ